MQTLRSKSFRTIYPYLVAQDEAQILFLQSHLVRSIAEKCQMPSTINTFFSCLDTRHAWAITWIDKTVENKIYRLFGFPTDSSTTRKRLRDILRIVRSDKSITTDMKERFLYLLPMPVLKLLYHSLN